LLCLIVYALSIKGASSGDITEAHVGEMNCLVVYMRPGDVLRMTPAAVARSLDCFGKDPQKSTTGLRIRPPLDAATVAALCEAIRVSDG
jgi:hypothetical protein